MASGNRKPEEASTPQYLRWLHRIMTRDVRKLPLRAGPTAKASSASRYFQAQAVFARCSECVFLYFCCFYYIRRGIRLNFQGVEIHNVLPWTVLEHLGRVDIESATNCSWRAAAAELYLDKQISRFIHLPCKEKRIKQNGWKPLPPINACNLREARAKLIEQILN